MAERLGSIDVAQLHAQQIETRNRFFGKEILPEPPMELTEFIERTCKLGFTFEPYLSPGKHFSSDSDYPGWVVRPQAWFFDQIKRGNISPDSVRLPLQWAAMETIERPSYDRGGQLYENDALASILEDLRKGGKIAVPDWCKHIPSVSRFGVSADEISGPVASRFAEVVKVNAVNVDAPTYMAFNYLGNIAHPEFGQANTAEWFVNIFARGYRLIGGNSDNDGLAGVGCDSSDGHRGDLGFRLLVAFPPKNA